MSDDKLIDTRVLSRMGECFDCRRFGYIDPDGESPSFCAKCWVEDELQFSDDYIEDGWHVEIVDE